MRFPAHESFSANKARDAYYIALLICRRAHNRNDLHEHVRKHACMLSKPVFLLNRQIVSHARCVRMQAHAFPDRTVSTTTT
jgi:hypothetical protein